MSEKTKGVMLGIAIERDRQRREMVRLRREEAENAAVQDEVENILRVVPGTSRRLAEEYVTAQRQRSLRFPV